MFDTITGEAARLAGYRSAPMSTPELEFIFEGYDFTGAVFRLEVRDRRDGGLLCAGLDTVAVADTEGMRLVSVETIDGLPVSVVHGFISEATMEAMPEQEPGEDHELVWGMHITPAGSAKFQAFDGTFILKASAVS